MRQYREHPMDIVSARGYNPRPSISRGRRLSNTAGATDVERLSLELYSRILQTANEFLHKCKHSSLTFLEQRRPTYEEMAKDCELLADIMSRLGGDSNPMRHQQVFEYCALMVRIGSAIASQNKAALMEAVEELDRKPFVLS
jgi:hypothetical protein